MTIQMININHFYQLILIATTLIQLISDIIHPQENITITTVVIIDYTILLLSKKVTKKLHLHHFIEENIKKIMIWIELIIDI